MKTILLTGATGFIGSHLLKHLVEQQYKVVVLKRSTSDILKITNLIDDIKTYDIDKEPIELAFEKNEIDAVVHLATAYGKNKNYEKLIQTNIIFGLNLIELSIKYGVGLFINTDTFFNDKANSQSYLSDYTTTKKHFLGWLQLKRDLIKIINLKIHHVYGENDAKDKFSMWLFNKLKEGTEKIELTSGNQLRDFIYVKDVVKAFEVVLMNNNLCVSMQEFNVSTGDKKTVKEFCTVMAYEIIRNSTRVEQVLLFGSIDNRPDEIMDIENDNSGLLRLGWKPEFNLVSGIHNMVSNIEA